MIEGFGCLLGVHYFLFIPFSGAGLKNNCGSGLALNPEASAIIFGRIERHLTEGGSHQLPAALCSPSASQQHPARRRSPTRKLIVLFATVLGFFYSFFHTPRNPPLIPMRGNQS
jgi:hypothetical protein